MLSRIHACMQLLKEKRHRRAAHLALEALGNHPASSELMHLLAEAEAAVKWYPHFRDALVQVTLTGPATTFTIGDVLTVKYNYSHQKPEHENKKFKPFSDWLQGLVTRHDQKVMRNSHLPQEQVDRVLQKVGGVEALNNMRTAEDAPELAPLRHSFQHQRQCLSLPPLFRKFFSITGVTRCKERERERERGRERERERGREARCGRERQEGREARQARPRLDSRQARRQEARQARRERQDGRQTRRPAAWGAYAPTNRCVWRVGAFTINLSRHTDKEELICWWARAGANTGQDTVTET